MPNRRGKNGNRDKFYFLGLQRMMWMWCVWMMHEYDVHSCTCMWMMTAAVELKDAYLKESYDKPRQHFKKRRHHFAYKGLSSQSYGFSSNCVWMWELDHKEGWAPKSWCFWTIVLEKTLESGLDSKEIKPVHPKGNQPWIFIGRTVAKAETLILWTLM